jgi:hypothetical protein
MLRSGFQVMRQFGNMRIEHGAPLDVSGGGGVAVCGVSRECRDPCLAVRYRATQAFMLTGQ